MTTPSVDGHSSSTRSSISRCPGCGEPTKQPSPARCPLCSFKFDTDAATGADLSPYAVAFGREVPGWRLMLLWVWLAGSARLKHVAMMRASAASRRFARINLLILAFAMGLIEWTRTGWAWTGGEVSREADALIQPDGSGWFRVATAPEPLPARWAVEAPTELWWNPARMLVAVPIAIVAAWLVLLVWGALLRFGVTRAHPPALRPERRMTAAVHYGTAWVIPLCAAALAFSLRPVSYFARVAHWPVQTDAEMFVIAGGVLAGFGLAMWWFWLLRLGSTAPPNARGAVVTFLAIGAPLVTVALVTAWWLALPFLCAPIFRAIGAGG